MPIKLLLEFIAAVGALVCFATMMKALVQLVKMHRAAKRKSQEARRAVPSKEIRKPMSRAG
jgi:hypothetical protein